MKTKIAFAILLLLLFFAFVFIYFNPDIGFPRINIFNWTWYSSNWVYSDYNVQFYSGGYCGQFYCGIIYPCLDFNGFDSNINIISRRKVKISGKTVNIPKGNNIVLVKPDFSFKLLYLPEKYFFKNKKSGLVETLNIEQLKRDGIWDKEISPYLNEIQ